MQAAQETMWRQLYREAFLELDARRVQAKLEIAWKAIENRLSELPSHSVSREILDLKDAKRMLGYLQENEQQS
jgi:hypothetical protein